MVLKRSNDKSDEKSDEKSSARKWVPLIIRENDQENDIPKLWYK
jgi:hypothetical protein